MTPAIIIVAYNRPQSLRRLLSSIDNSVFGTEAVTLVISIDYKDSEEHGEVVRVANEFRWKFGQKVVIEHKENLGLRKHVLSCGDMAATYGSIIVLEDDLVVSPYFYSYAQKALTYYGTDTQIAGISLYQHKINFANGLPFELVAEYADVFFMKIASSWGQAWTNQQWVAFKVWYDANPQIQPADKIPATIKIWPDSSWLKYFIKYLADTDKYFVYPKNAYTTNFGDSGTHNMKRNPVFQVPLSMNGPKEFRFVSLAQSLNKYDSYFELDADIIKQFNDELTGYDFIVDLYGLKDLTVFKQPYAISSKKLKGNSAIKQFDLAVKPMALNLMVASSGDYFNLAKKEDFHLVGTLPINKYTWGYLWGRVNILNMSRVLVEELRLKWINKIIKIK